MNLTLVVFVSSKVFKYTDYPIFGQNKSVGILAWYANPWNSKFGKNQIYEKLKTSKLQKRRLWKTWLFRISRISEMDSAYKNEPKTVFGVNGLFKLS